ncbi:hypothetical protein LX99_04300 [Mucilaginibacter oryzae]|uniref:Uncharacterized protein n=1 Tax=Mucilaginibacter oryzae TaxID=468058 RepID=A0A316H2L3_9SPHI|nr:hypothetical protein [Mucilaginibacter oryzae]PWK72969.1 hypothetical protein LX99_04300 [Mucilaginibacter oryzae]
MIASLLTYSHIKNLCSFFKRTHNGFKLVNNERIIVLTGNMRGLVLYFNRDACEVRNGNHDFISIDITRNFSVDMLMQVLASHNIISPFFE